jgi:hypothetical protein
MPTQHPGARAAVQLGGDECEVLGKLLLRFINLRCVGGAT